MRDNRGTSHAAGAPCLWGGGVTLRIGAFFGTAVVPVANNRHSPMIEPRC